MKCYLELTKPRITLMILICTAVGHRFGCGTSFHGTILAYALLGTAMLASAAALNQWYEVESDAKMRRKAGDLFPRDGSTEQTGSLSACCYWAQASQTYGLGRMG